MYTESAVALQSDSGLHLLVTENDNAPSSVVSSRYSLEFASTLESGIQVLPSTILLRFWIAQSDYALEWNPVPESFKIILLEP